MGRVEARLPLERSSEIMLSTRMRESWDDGRFWFNLASRSSFDMDDIYWEVLHTDEVGAAVAGELSDAEKQKYLKKQDQLDVHQRETETT